METFRFTSFNTYIVHVLVVHKIFLVDAHKKFEATDATVFVTRSHRSRALQRQSQQFWNYVRARTRFYEMKSYFENVRRRRRRRDVCKVLWKYEYNKYILVFRSFSKS